MVRPATLSRVIQELVRIFPCSREAFQNAFLQHVFGAGAFPNLFEQAVPNLFLQKLQRLEQSNPGSASKLFSAFPPVADRVAATQKNISLILPARSQNILTTPEFDRIKALLGK